MTKLISQQDEWNRVAAELGAESVKLKSYDQTLLTLLGDLKGCKALDYGCGPGILAAALQRLGADIHTYDLSAEMRQLCGEKIGSGRVYSSVGQIPKTNFDAVICNLVLCIVEEDEVRNIAKNIGKALNAEGRAYIGFCNPKIFDIPESQLDFRFQTGNEYQENHRYKKIKKEGGYEIMEDHRSIEWYERVYQQAGLELVQTHFTPSYQLQGRTIADFVIFELKRAKS